MASSRKYRSLTIAHNRERRKMKAVTREGHLRKIIRSENRMLREQFGVTP